MSKSEIKKLSRQGMNPGYKGNDPAVKANKIIIRRADGFKDVSTEPVGDSLTQQQFKEESDVNNIVAKYAKTGTLTHLRNAETGVYMDLTNLPDLHEAQNILMQAETAFREVPAEIRNRFGNDPAQMVQFLADEKNRDEAIKLGLVVPPPPPAEDPVLNELKTLNKNLNDKKSSKNPEA